MSKFTPVHGAKNLLLNCAKANAGDRLLIAYESADLGYFDAGAVECLLSSAKSLHLNVETLDVGFNPTNPTLTPEILSRFEAVDIIVFLARLGDQLRFSDMPPGKTIIVSYAMNGTLFGSDFGNAHYGAFLEIKSAIDRTILGAGKIRFTCPAGTDVTGVPDVTPGDQVDTSILRFPMSVFSPVPARTFSGRVALAGFLTGTGSRYFDDYHLDFDNQVFATLQQGRLAGFKGDLSDTAKANAYYDRVSGLFGIDRNFVHSWHAGIHPGCGYPWDINENPERWGGAAFGNPRILHFHTCGAYAPGEISWNVIDPTIIIDGVTVWDKGVFHVDRVSGGAEILARYPCTAKLFANPDRNIGLNEQAE